MNLQTTNTHHAEHLPDTSKVLLRTMAGCAYDKEQLCSKLTTLISENPILLDNYPLVAGGYSRTILYRNDSGFEALVARWSKDAITPIHGHPQFAFVYLIHGELNMELFAGKDKSIHKTSQHVLRPGTYSYSKGTAGKFDNAIHRVSATLDSLSFHIYSDDALKGETYSE